VTTPPVDDITLFLQELSGRRAELVALINAGIVRSATSFSQLSTDRRGIVASALADVLVATLEQLSPAPLGALFDADLLPADRRNMIELLVPNFAHEQERVELQQQVIAAQQAALRELSTPIIPIGEGVVAMPLIGNIDSARAQQVIETLLEGVGESRARTAILDITGVQVVDSQVADALLRAAQAVRLLGAEVIITGIRPEVAQTLVGLGLDLSGIKTLSTLQAGIAYALNSIARR